MAIVQAKELRICDYCGKEKTEVDSSKSRAWVPAGWSIFDHEGGRCELGPECTQKLLAAVPGLLGVVKERKLGACADCG